MIRRLLASALLGLTFLLGPAVAAGDPAPAATAPAAEDRRLLVMLKLAPEHYRPGGDYGAGYGDALAAAARRRLAQRIARAESLRLVESWPMPLLGVDCVVMEVDGGRALEPIAARVSRLPGVAWSQPMHAFHTEGAPPQHNDRLYRAQPSTREWHLGELHRIATGRGATVAVIDSRVDAAHPDLRGQIAASEDFVGGPARGAEAHGTGVAGIIAAHADNGVGIAGVAPGARLLALRACWERPDQPAITTCDSLSLAKALTFAIERGAGIINMSLTGPRDQLLAALARAAAIRGATIVAAWDRAAADGGFPASLPGVIAVADESLSAPRPGVYTAPGRDVPTTEPGGRWSLVSGSSFAAAHVSGLLALMRQVGATRAPGRLLLSSPVGSGAIDACGTLLRAARRGEGGCATRG